MEKRFRDNIYCDYRELAQKHKTLSLRLIQKFYQQINLPDVKEIISKIFKPLFSNAKECYLYKDGDKIPTENNVLKLLKKRGARYEFNLDEDIFYGIEKFWGSLGFRRGTILCSCQYENINFKDLFSKTYDPYFVGTPKRIFSNAALKYAHKKTEENPNNIFFSLPSYYGLEQITIFMSEQIIGDHIELALNNCILSEGYLSRTNLESYYLLDKNKSQEMNDSLIKINNDSQAIVSKIRYTDQFPPVDIVIKYPNWTDCLDEEAVEGQDESTIRPDKVQNIIGDGALYTAAKVIYPDGSEHIGLLFAAACLNDDGPETLFILEPEFEWGIEILDDNEWVESDLTENTISSKDKTRLPMMVKSLLPLPDKKTYIEFKVENSGKLSGMVP